MNADNESERERENKNLDSRIDCNNIVYDCALAFANRELLMMRILLKIISNIYYICGQNNELCYSLARIYYTNLCDVQRSLYDLVVAKTKQKSSLAFKIIIFIFEEEGQNHFGVIAVITIAFRYDLFDMLIVILCVCFHSSSSKIECILDFSFSFFFKEKVKSK